MASKPQVVALTELTGPASTGSMSSGLTKRPTLFTPALDATELTSSASASRTRTVLLIQWAS